MVIAAAGGILWRDGSRREFAVVHRRRRDDWCLPKGKLQAGETPAAAARREVREETGWEVQLGDRAGEIAYDVGGDEKRVVFWNMTRMAGAARQALDAEEVAAVQWFDVEPGLARLSYPAERRLVRDNAGP